MVSFTVIFVLFNACVLTYGNSAGNFIEPVPFRGASVEKFKGTYYLVKNDLDLFISLSTSSDLKDWSNSDAILDLMQLPAWLEHNDNRFKTPELYISPSGEFYVFFDTYNNCIGVAVSNSSSGPYVISDKPILCSFDARQDAFDFPSVLFDNGSLILYYQHSSFGKTSIEARVLSSDLSVASEAVPVMFPDPEVATKNVSTSRVFKRDNVYYLIYGTDMCGELYIARSFSPFGPFVRQGNVPFNSAGNPLKKPRHVDVVPDENGKLAVVATDSSDIFFCYPGYLKYYSLKWKSDDWPELV